MYIHITIYKLYVCIYVYIYIYTSMCIYIYIYIHMHYTIRFHNLLPESPLLKNTRVRQVVLDKGFPLTIAMLPQWRDCRTRCPTSSTI